MQNNNGYPQHVQVHSEQRRRAAERKAQDAILNQYFTDGGTITIRYRLTGEDETVIVGAGRKEWAGVLNKVAHNYLRRGNVAEWPSYSYEQG